MSEFIKEDFQKIFNTDNLKNYDLYFLSMRNFVTNHKYYFNKKNIERWDLYSLLEINPEEYLSRESGINLNFEKNRLLSVNNSRFDYIGLAVSNTMWELVRHYSIKECPITPEIDLYFEWLEIESELKIVLRCEECGWIEDINGSEVKYDSNKRFPVKRTCANEINNLFKK